MRTKALAALGLAVALAATSARGEEPAYLEKPMSAWLALLRQEPKDPKNPEVEWSRAPMALAHIGEPAARAVASVLLDTSVGARRRAATCLLAMGPQGKAATPELLKTLKGDRETAVRQTAAAALGATQAASPAVVAGLVEALKDPEAPVRESAATSLGRLRATDAVPALEALAQDPSMAVQRAGRKALSRIKGTTSPK